jgi:uncharacterized membrane protein YeaQ/YmgE (transglycosylase-associated protein family)
MYLVFSLILGGLTGIFGRKFMSGPGYGLVADAVLGIFGGLVGGWIAGMIVGTQGVGAVISCIVAVAAAAVLVGVSHKAKSQPGSS